MTRPGERCTTKAGIEPKSEALETEGSRDSNVSNNALAERSSREGTWLTFKRA